MEIDPNWFAALTLAERAALLRAARDAAPAHETDAGAEYDAARAAFHFARWRAQAPFDDEPLFTQRLAADGLDEASFQRILGASPHALGRDAAALPDWLATFNAAFADPEPPIPEPGEGEFGFLEVVQPLVDHAGFRLAAAVDELIAAWPAPPFDLAQVEEVLLANLPEPLLMRLGRTMVLELNIARLLEQLHGETAAARFSSFITRLQDADEAYRILADYPVLARQLVVCIEQWLEVSVEFLHRLCTDWADICACFSPGRNPGPLVEVSGGAGDTHRGGRSVMIAEFASGLRLVYKPKSLAVDLHFQDLVHWLNARGFTPPLQPLVVLDRSEYGWVEFVEHRGCENRAEVERYYQRLGGYLALLYAINASDFHLENLIAHGEQPLLIDLETLFNPEFERLDLPDAAAQAAKAMLDSVLVVGMLPQRLWSDDEYGGLDISGLAGEEGQLTPDRIPMPAEEGTDVMRYVRERTALEAEANRPMLQGVVTSAVDYMDDFLGGFRAMYRLLMAHRAALLAADGPLARFAHDETRVLLRPTRTYDQLLFESFHPDMLQDGLVRDLHWDRLWLVVPERPFMADVVAVEQADLRCGDIPLFTTQPASLDLFGVMGERITGVLTESGMAVARRRLARLSDDDMRRQEWVIRCTLATVAPSGRGFDRPPTRNRRSPHATSPTQATRASLSACARAAADYLTDHAIVGAEDVTWLGLTPLPQEYWDLGPLEMDLYGGIAGVTLFLAYAGALLREPRYTSMAQRGCAVLVRHVADLGEELPGVGGFVGWGGALYTLTHLAALWRDEALADQADAAVAAIASFVADDDAFGVMYGAAGAIGALLAHHHAARSDAAVRTAVACGEHLLAAAQPQAVGIGWVNAEFGPHALTGYAHGAAGIAWALLELAAVTGELRFRQAAQQALAYERSLYLPAAGNWPDLRITATLPAANGDGPPRCMCAWCHGAVGIGLARVQALRHLDDPLLAAEIDAAVTATQAHGLGDNHSLCHGDLGSLELLLQADLVRATARRRAPHGQGAHADLVNAVVADIMQRGRRCGGPEAVEMPGLMLGVAGIGYQLLRLADPAHVPSVLLMAPPVRS